jgi:hypothetical protein
VLGAALVSGMRVLLKAIRMVLGPSCFFHELHEFTDGSVRAVAEPPLLHTFSLNEANTHISKQSAATHNWTAQPAL